MLQFKVKVWKVLARRTASIDMILDLFHMSGPLAAPKQKRISSSVYRTEGDQAHLQPLRRTAHVPQGRKNVVQSQYNVLSLAYIPLSYTTVLLSYRHRMIQLDNLLDCGLASQTSCCAHRMASSCSSRLHVAIVISITPLRPFRSHLHPTLPKLPNAFRLVSISALTFLKFACQ